MLRTFKELQKEDLKIGKGESILLATEKTRGAEFFGIRIAIVFLFILSLASLVGAGVLYQSLNAQRNERKTLEANEIQLREKIQSFETEEKNYHQDTAKLSEQVRTYEAQQPALAKQLEDGAAHIKVLENSLEIYKKRNQFLEGKIAEFEAQLKPPPDVKAPVPAQAAGKSSAPAVPAIDQKKILTLNRKFGFVIVNLGLHDNLKKGETLFVQRNGKKVGKLEVEKTYDGFSAAKIIDEPKKEPFQEGDAISRS